jgi:uncharacterized secreted protein with C-terminal beta-propeller domain
VGEDTNRVKLSLFDVSDPTNPVEKDTYQLEEYWSEISQTHHAFLLDSDNSTFFIPGGNAAYFFSYDDTGELELKKAVSGVRAKRGLYIDKYWYIVAPDETVAVDMTTWERVEDVTY